MYSNLAFNLNNFYCFAESVQLYEGTAFLVRKSKCFHSYLLFFFFYLLPVENEARFVSIAAGRCTDSLAGGLCITF